MLIRGSILFVVFLVLAIGATAQQHGSPKRDAAAIEILTRTATAGGGPALSGLRDLTESGEITFYWGEHVKGPVVIRSLGGSHFRMDADLPQGKSTWLVRDGIGYRNEAGQDRRISGENSINLGSLTFPLTHVRAALADGTTDISLVGIEKRDGRSVYRLRLKGSLGLAPKAEPLSVVKDLVVDALTFDILSVGDHPYLTYERGGKPSDIAPREVDFSDFRVVNGVRVPFSIVTRLQGQQTLSIQLSQVVLNTNLSDGDFQK